MKLISRKDRAKSAVNAFFRTYSVDGVVPKSKYLNKQEIYENLVNLGDDPMPEDVNSVIGNSTWTDVKCNECGEYVEIAVEIGEELDYESNTAIICKDCLKKALIMGETK